MREKITAHQLLSIMILLPYGSAVLFFLTPETKQNIWFALMFYAIVALLFQFIYTNIYKNYPGESIVTYMPKIYGKILGSIISMMYIVYFVYLAGRVLRDFLELIRTFTMPRTPILFTGALITVTIIYGVFKGLENIASIAEIFLIIVLISSLALLLLIAVTGDVIHPSNLLPVLEDGILPVISKGWKLASFPYGEFIVLTMFYPYVIEQNKIRKALFFGCISEGLILTINNILFIVTLGVSFATTNNFPLFETLRLVHIGEFLSRLDILYVILLLEGAFFKISLCLYAAILGTTQLFKINNKDWGALCILFGIIMLTISLSIAKNYPEHIKIGLALIINTINLPIQIYIPTITFLFINIKNFLCSRSHN
ncbi:GerAB/ArcD/ProY family transporter [Clostridium akagii]|uniref:GerAB/ArcD/ProY family transporter n=1 Tax=Clostridium akagii TaxID=91623 RepID=UPI00047D064C|nr:GerAB/ArcD/ProY family transporter [Clostridium akagii]